MRAWPAFEHGGAILVWHDPAQGAPAFEVPPHPELADPVWLPVERHEFTIATCIQEIAENAHDPAHFSAVHGVPALPENEARFEGPRQVAENRGRFTTPRGPVETSIREFVRQFHQDIPIWEAKRYLARPVLCDGDGEIGKFRRWARQFYATE